MAVVWAPTVTNGTNGTSYGYWPFGSLGSIDDATADMYGGATIIVAGWATSDTKIRFSFVGNVIGNWDTVTLGGVTYNYSDFTRTYDGTFSTTFLQNGTTSTNPFPAASTTTITFETTPAITAPVISSASSSNASASSVNAEVKLSSNGSGGTLEFAQTTTNSVPATGWQSSANFSHKRGTTRYYWASQDQDTAGAYDDSGAVFVNYISPDTTVTFSNSALQITSAATSATVGLQTVTSGESYQVRNQAGTATYATQTASSTSVNITFSTGLPTAGNTLTYQIYSMRPNSIGGDDAYDATGDFFTVERLAAAADATPENYTNLAGNKTNAALSTNYYATFSTSVPGTTEPGTGFSIGTQVDSGTAISVASGQYRINSGSWTSTSGTVNQNDTVYYRRQSSASNNDPVTGSLTIGTVTRTFDITTVAAVSIDPPTEIVFQSDPGTSASSVSLTVTASATLGAGSSAATITVAGPFLTDNYGYHYSLGGSISPDPYSTTGGYDVTQIRFDDGSNWFWLYLDNGVSAPADSATTFSSLTISTGVSTTATVLRSSRLASGVSGTSRYWVWNSTGWPGGATAYNNAEAYWKIASTVTIELDTAAGGGTSGVVQVSEDNSNWDTNGTAYTFRRGISKTVYARVFDSPDASSSYSDSLTLDYLPPDTSVSAANVTINNTATSAPVIVGDTTSGETYRVYNSTGTVGYQSAVASGSSVTITLTSALPSVGTPVTYRIYSSRPNSLGGDGLYDYTGTTFTITRTAGIVAPVISSVTDNNAAAASVTVSVNLTSNGSGGTLEFARNTTNSVPSTGWQTGSSFSQSRSSNYYYFASQSRDTAGSYDGGEYHPVPYLAPDITVTLTPQNQVIDVDSTSAVFTISNGSSVDTYRLEDQYGDSLGTRVGNGDIHVESTAQGWPSVGGTINFTVEASKSASIGGSGIYQTTSVTGSLSRSDSPTISNVTIGSTFSGDLSVDILNGVQTQEGYAISLTTGLASSAVVSNSLDVISPYDGSALVIPSANLPTAGNTTYYFYSIRYSAYGGSNTWQEIGSFTVTRSTATGSGSSDYGMVVYGTDGTTEVFSTNFRATNIQAFYPFSLSSGSSEVFTCLNANDSSRIILTFLAEVQDVAISATTSTSFTLTNNSSFSRAGTVLAIRRG